MFHRPTTKAEAAKYFYGKWAGNPKGFRYNSAWCAAEIEEPFVRMRYCQCSRMNGHGPDGLYCKQHAKMMAIKETEQ